MSTSGAYEQLRPNISHAYKTDSVVAMLVFDSSSLVSGLLLANTCTFIVFIDACYSEIGLSVTNAAHCL